MNQRLGALLALCLASAIGCAQSHGGDGGVATTSPDGSTPDSGATGDAGSAAGCPGYPGQSPSGLPGAGCCMAESSHCVPESSIPPGLDSAFATCSGGLCVPDPIIEAGSSYVPTSCVAPLLGMMLDGVCLSECITLVSSNPDEALLPQSTCAMGELCVPCLNPLNMMPTGACSFASLICGGADGGTDGGAADAGGPMCPYTGPALVNASQFPACSPTCAGAHCVPAALVPAAEQLQLAACTGGFCAPDTFIESAGLAVPQTCKSIADAEGRCLSTCLPAIAAEADILPVDVCASGEVCAPCYDPVSADPTVPTGACSLACDKPADPPTIVSCPYTGTALINPDVFPACAPACAGAHCVPAALVPAGQQSQLATCPGGFCAPDSITQNAGESVPTMCTSVAGAEGRCLSTCLPQIEAEAPLLPVDVCGSGQVCVPCYDPVGADPMTPTGACTTSCDMPVDPPTILACPWTGPDVIDPSTLPACDNGGCGGAHCLPASGVPAAEQSQLAPCDGGFCTPDIITSTGNNFIPTSCDPFPGTGAPGRCLSDCLPEIAAEADGGTIVQGSCSTGELCVPCNDPFTGKSTGACTLGCDKPPAKPFTFPQCCDNGTGTLTGTCVPSAQVPASQASDLDQSGNGNSTPCPANGASYLCVPDEYLPAPYNTLPLQFCQATFFDFCGSCVSQCVNNSLLSVLTDSDCSANHVCVECGVDSSAPGCSSFCASGANCGNSCGCDGDCGGNVCGVCNGGSGVCGDGSGDCETQ